MIATAILLAVGWAAAMIGALALLRLMTPFERLHVSTFVAVAGGIALTVAAFVSEGVTDRTLKLVAIVVVLVVSGALANHATARALHYRDGERR